MMVFGFRGKVRDGGVRLEAANFSAFKAKGWFSNTTRVRLRGRIFIRVLQFTLKNTGPGIMMYK